ncbi:family 16 glycoside hydrolase [Chthoniobacter flavus]|nr:family 16 glycoside hydrolase [Chthoniobacter flavus]
MNSVLRLAMLCLLAVLAEAKADIAEDQPLLAVRGSLLFEDDFSRPDLTPKWNVGLGRWEIKDGVATAAEKPEDHHGAYAFINPNTTYKDVIAEFDFKMNGASDLVLNMRKQGFKGSQAGHILRVSIMLNKVQLADMKEGGMKWEYYNIKKDPNATAEAKAAVDAKLKDKQATFTTTYEYGAWHHARAEVAGDELLFMVDGKAVGYLKSPGIDHPTKNMLGFTIAGKNMKTASIKNPKFWHATPNPEWAKRRDEVLAGLTK